MIRQPMKSIAVTKPPSSRFFEQQDAKTFTRERIALPFMLSGDGQTWEKLADLHELSQRLRSSGVLLKTRRKRKAQAVV